MVLREREKVSYGIDTLEKKLSKDMKFFLAAKRGPLTIERTRQAWQKLTRRKDSVIHNSPLPIHHFSETSGE